MTQEKNWRPPTGGEEVMRQMEKRLKRAERRPNPTKAADFMGPALGPYAVEVDDLNSETATFNGIISVPIGATNGPLPTAPLVGEVLGISGVGGRQVLSTYRAIDVPHRTWVRTFNYIAGTTNIIWGDWSEQGGGSGTPPGVLAHTAAASAPAGWLACDGTAVSRTTYSALFDAIGTQHGAGNGSTTFNLPNIKGRTLVGLDTAQTEFNTRGKNGGAKTHTLTALEMPAHNHDSGPTTSGFLAHLTALIPGYVAMQAGSGAQAVVTRQPASAGGGGAHNNLQPYIAELAIIKT